MPCNPFQILHRERTCRFEGHRTIGRVHYTVQLHGEDFTAETTFDVYDRTTLTTTVYFTSHAANHFQLTVGDTWTTKLEAFVNELIMQEGLNGDVHVEHTETSTQQLYQEV